MSSALAQNSQLLQTKTRFGTLTLDDQNEVTFNARPLEPSIKVNSGMDMGTPFHIGPADVVLVIDYGGTACPVQYYFVTANKSGAKATPAFGTCAEETGIQRSGDSILVTMHGYRGPFEPDGERRKAARETHVFVYRDGAVTERGQKP
ncbi:MAG TPA: hypothetical protein VHU83_17425 [Bryobacteraceae bacterium]|nr:hypothetical protein [Bryobacteraceae bacterium]